MRYLDLLAALGSCRCAVAPLFLMAVGCLTGMTTSHGAERGDVMYIEDFSTPPTHPITKQQSPAALSPQIRSTRAGSAISPSPTTTPESTSRPHTRQELTQSESQSSGWSWKLPAPTIPNPLSRIKNPLTGFKNPFSQWMAAKPAPSPTTLRKDMPQRFAVDPAQQRQQLMAPQQAAAQQNTPNHRTPPRGLLDVLRGGEQGSPASQRVSSPTSTVATRSLQPTEQAAMAAAARSREPQKGKTVINRPAAQHVATTQPAMKTSVTMSDRAIASSKLPPAKTLPEKSSSPAGLTPIGKLPVVIAPPPSVVRPALLIEPNTAPQQTTAGPPASATPQPIRNQYVLTENTEPATNLLSAARRAVYTRTAAAHAQPNRPTKEAPKPRPASKLRPLHHTSNNRKPADQSEDQTNAKSPAKAPPQEKASPTTTTTTSTKTASAPNSSAKLIERPSAKAIELLTSANDASQTATTEEEFSQVIQSCRYVLAIDHSPIAVRYSQELAAWALNRRGELKADQARVPEALLDFEDALKLDSHCWRAIHNQGVLTAQAGNFAEAFECFNRTIEINPRFAKAYSNRAALHLKAGNLGAASKDYRMAIDRDPELAVAHKGLARVCHMQGDFDVAVQHFAAARILSPEDARIANDRGDLMVDMGRYHEATANYREAMALDPALGTAYRSLAWLQATCPEKSWRNPEAALANAQRAIELAEEPTDIDYDTLAAAQALAGDYAAALKNIDQAIALAGETIRENYQWRRKLYERQQPYFTEPFTSVQSVSYTD